MARKKRNAAIELPPLVIALTTDFLGTRAVNKLTGQQSATLFDLAARYGRDVALTLEAVAKQENEG